MTEDLMSKDVIERSFKLVNTERRARALVDAAVASAMRTAPNLDERDFAKYASYIALDATACLMRMIYEEDAELKALREERNRYKAMAEELMHLTPPKLTPVRKLNLRPSINTGTKKDGD